MITTSNVRKIDKSTKIKSCKKKKKKNAKSESKIYGKKYKGCHKSYMYKDPTCFLETKSVVPILFFSLLSPNLDFNTLLSTSIFTNIKDFAFFFFFLQNFKLSRQDK